MSQFENFEALMVDLCSADNNAQFNASEMKEKLTYMFQLCLQQKPYQTTNDMCSVLMRKTFANKQFNEFWNTMSKENKDCFMDNVLMLLNFASSSNKLLTKYCDCICEFVRFLIEYSEDNKDLAKFLQIICVNAISDELNVCLTSLYIINEIPSMFQNPIDGLQDVIVSIFDKNMTKTNQNELLYMCSRALCSFIMFNLGESEEYGNYTKYVPYLIEVYKLSVGQDNHELIRSIIEVAEHCPKYLCGYIRPIFNVSIPIVTNQEFDEDWRSYAMELMITICEAVPAATRKLEDVVTQFVKVLLHTMTELDDDEQKWLETDDDDDSYEDTLSNTAEATLDRLSICIGGKLVVNSFFSQLEMMITNEDWKFRYAAMMAISSIGEGGSKEMEPYLSDLVQACSHLSKDENSRVRYAACNAIGQMSTDFAPSFQKAYHAEILTIICSRMEDSADRVIAHAASALVNFCDECLKSVLVPYMEKIINALQGVMNKTLIEFINNDKKLVLEHTVTALAAIADTTEVAFLKYYDYFMPGLKSIVGHCAQKKCGVFRGKTIECISLIGVAVGKEKFMSDCEDVISLLLETQKAQQEENVQFDDVEHSYMVSAWARMCKIMGRDFTKYLPIVMPPLMEAAQFCPEVRYCDKDERKVVENSEDWEVIPVSDAKSLAVRTTGLEEKESAFSMLICYAQELKGGFCDYVKDSLTLMTSHLSFQLDDSCRSLAAEAIPHLLECVKDGSDETKMREVWSNYVVNEYLSAVAQETETNVCTDLVDNLATCISMIGDCVFNDDQMNQMMNIIKGKLSEHNDNQVSRATKRDEEFYDEIVEAELMEEDEDSLFMLHRCNDLISSLFEIYKERFEPSFEQLLPVIYEMNRPTKPYADRNWALNVYVSIIKNLGKRSFHYKDYFIAPIKDYIIHNDQDLRQSACYIIGIMAEHGDGVYNQYIEECLPVLISICKDTSEKDYNYILAKENAVASIARIMKFVKGYIEAPELLKTWFSWLPVTEDEEEAVFVYDFLCDLIGGGHELFYENRENIVKSIEHFADVLFAGSIDEESTTYSRIKNIISDIYKDENLRSQYIDSLSEQRRDALHQMLNI